MSCRLGKCHPSRVPLRGIMNEQVASRRPIWSKLIAVDELAQWTEDRMSALVVNNPCLLLCCHDLIYLAVRGHCSIVLRLVTAVVSPICTNEALLRQASEAQWRWSVTKYGGSGSFRSTHQTVSDYTLCQWFANTQQSRFLTTCRRLEKLVLPSIFDTQVFHPWWRETCRVIQQQFWMKECDIFRGGGPNILWPLLHSFRGSQDPPTPLPRMPLRPWWSWRPTMNHFTCNVPMAFL